jgi:hypothetical protein
MKSQKTVLAGTADEVAASSVCALAGIPGSWRGAVEAQAGVEAVLTVPPMAV